MRMQASRWVESARRQELSKVGGEELKTEGLRDVVN